VERREADKQQLTQAKQSIHTRTQRGMRGACKDIGNQNVIIPCAAPLALWRLWE